MKSHGPDSQPESQPDFRGEHPDDVPQLPASARVVDPEDDLLPTRHPIAPETDPETRIIPQYSSRGYSSDMASGAVYEDYASGDSAGYTGYLPYVPPISHTTSDSYDDPFSTALPSGSPSNPVAMSSSGAIPVEIGPGDADQRLKAARRRGTQDLGLLVLRWGIGVLFIGHGLQKTFGWWGGSGIDGLRGSLSAAGYRYPDVMAYVGSGAQIAVGVLLILGLFTPLAAAAALAYVVNAALLVIDTARADGYAAVIASEQVQYLVVLCVAVVAIVLVGPGRYGFDAARGWARRPFIGSFLALVLGVGGGIAGWIFLQGDIPLF